MRILGLTNLFPSPWFPLRGVFNRQQFGALAKRESLRLIVPVSWTDELRTKRGDHPLLTRRRCELEGIEIEYPRYLFPPKVLRGSYGHCLHMSVERAFFDAVDEFRPDIILSAWAYPDGWAAVRLARRTGLPVVVKLHGSDVLVLSKNRACRARISETLRLADGVMTVSEDLGRKAIALGATANSVRTIYDGIDASRFYPGERREALARLELPGESPVLLFIGNLLPVKGVDVLIRACGELQRSGLAFRCFLIGQGPLRSKLQQLIEQLGLVESVKLMGPLPHKQLPDWYRAADVFVLPSYSEGVPCVLLEAAACQTPFVATRVGGVPEAAQWGKSRLVPAGDAPALAKAIADTLKLSSADPPGPAFVRTHADAAEDIIAFLQDTLKRTVNSSAARLKDSVSSVVC